VIVIVAIFGLARADASFTGIVNCGGITVITAASIWRVDATCGRITGVVGTDIAIVAVYRSA
jgi:hypothetical protein